jgi:hypothetical protein
MIYQFCFSALYLVFAFQKKKPKWNAEGRPEFQGRSGEAAEKRGSEDGNGSKASKCLRSSDPTVGNDGETL